MDLNTREGVFELVDQTAIWVRKEFEMEGAVDLQFSVLALVDGAVTLHVCAAPGMSGQEFSRAVHDHVERLHAVGVILVYEAWVSKTRKYRDFSQDPDAKEVVDIKLEHSEFGVHRWVAQITRTNGVTLGPFDKIEQAVSKGRLSDFIPVPAPTRQ